MAIGSLFLFYSEGLTARTLPDMITPARIRYHLAVSSLVHPERESGQDLDALRARVAALEADLDARDTDVTRTKSALEAFRIRYRSEVGLLHEQLDELELQLAEAELGVVSERIGTNGVEAEGAPAPERPEPLPRLTSDAVRKLFRDVAKAIHPDLAGDADRARRHSLMIEANRAYALGDLDQLRAILQAWERSPESVQGTDQEAMRLRLVRRIAQLEEHLQVLAAELGTMKDTSLWKLKAMVDDEAAKGKDLIADMVRRLKRDILVARNRLDAIRSSEPE